MSEKVPYISFHSIRRMVVLDEANILYVEYTNDTFICIKNSYVFQQTKLFAHIKKMYEAIFCNNNIC